MTQRKYRLFHLLIPSVLGITSGCTQENLHSEALEILSEDDDLQNIIIQKSEDGLQFTNNSSDSVNKASIGFSNEGHLSYKGDFKNGKPHGLWTTYFPDGKPRWQGYKKDGANHGSFTIWYENGRKRLEGVYENGKKHGHSTAWHPNGAKWQHKSYHLGHPIGIWKTWDKQGNIISEISHGSPAGINASGSIPD